MNNDAIVLSPQANVRVSREGKNILPLLYLSLFFFCFLFPILQLVQLF